MKTGDLIREKGNKGGFASLYFITNIVDGVNAYVDEALRQRSSTVVRLADCEVVPENDPMRLNLKKLQALANLELQTHFLMYALKTEHHDETRPRNDWHDLRVAMHELTEAYNESES